MDGPLAVFSTSSWLTKVIEDELIRINELQKEINGQDLLVIGIEKSGTFLITLSKLMPTLTELQIFFQNNLPCFLQTII
ncbi:MAG: hypothetical protein LIP05_09615 [Tannerellaceae bacterium]|nr:hypothetical protein [Tannerellaceae bacterium]